jgi:hypothetical protein
MAKFLDVTLQERKEPEQEIKIQKPRYDWRFENSITSGKEVDVDSEYSQWRTNSVLSNYRETILYANEMNCHYGVTDQMHYDYLYNSIRKRKMRGVKETDKEKADRKKKEELQTLVSNYYKYNIVRTKEALKILTPQQIELIKNKNNKGGVK